MKLNRDYILHNTDSETILVPTGSAGFSGVVRGNKTLGAALELLRDEMTEDELIAVMKDRFDAPDGAIERDINKLLNELRKIGALDE